MFEHQLKEPAETAGGTEQRLLAAAGEIFAEHGYRVATVRQICEKAGANIAAVNYYYGDKERLYLAVLRSVPEAHAVKYPSRSGLSAEATPAEQLRAYVRSLLHRVFDPGRPGWHSKIIARELVEPTRALDSLLEEVARPLHRELNAIVRSILDADADDETVRFCALSVMGQCVYYHNARNVLTRLYPEQKYSVDDITRLVDHVTDFSLAALRAIAQRKQAPQNAGR